MYVYVCVKYTVREGHGGGSRGTSAIEPFGGCDSYSAADNAAADSSNHMCDSGQSNKQLH